MKGLSLSGASTKIPVIAGAAITVCEKFGYKPDCISGVSAGSIIALPLALGLYKEVKEWTTSFTADDIFSIKPVNSRGNVTFRAKCRLVAGKASLGSQEQLTETLKKIITYERFSDYIIGDYPDCYLGMVEFKTGIKKYVSVKDLDYEEYFDAVQASSSIPVFVEPREFANGYWFDGGVRDHIGSHWLMEHKDITEHVSIYSRPKDYDITDYQWKPDGVISVLSRALDIMNTEISKNDEFKEDMIAKRKKIKNTKIFTPYVLTSTSYDIGTLKTWYEIGVNAVKKI